jgi:hypothetical protein
VFNKATATIKVETGEDGNIQIKKDNDVDAKATAKKILYGAFVKAGDATSEKEKDYSKPVTDKELFEACEGRTARKGARGEQLGKLARAGQLLIPNTTETTIKIKKKKSKKKSKVSKKKKQ